MLNPKDLQTIMQMIQKAVESEKQELKDAFSIAEKNGSPMWQHVISFDNRWLQENGMYDPDTQSLNENRIKEAVRVSILGQQPEILKIRQLRDSIL